MNLGQRIVTGMINGYRILVSPLLGTRCRYHPTCSAYTAEAVMKRGAIRGMALGLNRLLRCHPWAVGGHDPVPDEKSDLCQSHFHSLKAKLER